MFGLIVSFVAAGSALLWAVKYCKDFTIEYEPAATDRTEAEPPPSFAVAIAPILFPIALIALKSVSEYPSLPLGEGLFYSTALLDRKITRQNSSHVPISYAVFCV